MPNNSYLRSTKKERELVNLARRAGNISSRSAGSKGKYDLYVWNPKAKTLLLIQVKTEKRANDMDITHMEKTEGVTVYSLQTNFRRRKVKPRRVSKTRKNSSVHRS